MAKPIQTGDLGGAMRSYHAQVDATPEREPGFNAPLSFHRLRGATLMLPPCGCDVVGGGTIPDPIRIKFCALHRGVLLGERAL